jgi:putative endonuclease
MKTNRQALGSWGETVAADYLSEQGFTILERNVRTPYGEIDLVACKESAEGRLVLFVEVKTRRSISYGLPEQSITARKQDHMLAAAQAFLQEHADIDADWRVDVITVQTNRSGLRPVITHFENVVN